MKMKPILFSTPMVQAILDGRKSMTRRVIKKIPNHMHCGKNIMDWDLSGVGELKEGALEFSVQCDVDDFYTDYAVAPYRPGDILWVRETWSKKDGHYFYKAGHELLIDSEPLIKRWRPSIHMPREAARIFLRVTNVRVERLHDITENDARNEGVKDPYDYQEPSYYNQPHVRGMEINKSAFAGLWDSLNAKRGYGWDVNPYVWVYEFERVEGE